RRPDAGGGARFHGLPRRAVRRAAVPDPVGARSLAGLPPRDRGRGPRRPSAPLPDLSPELLRVPGAEGRGGGGARRPPRGAAEDGPRAAARGVQRSLARDSTRVP